MGYRENILELLYRHLDKIFIDNKVYQHAAECSKKILFKNFFRKLAHQKKSFHKRTSHEIYILENELEIMGTSFKRKEPEPLGKAVGILPAFRTEKDGFLKECFRREKRNLEQYNYLLSKICKGSIREMLLFQKHSVQLILEEMKSMGIRIYEGAEDEKNRGEINYR